MNDADRCRLMRVDCLKMAEAAGASGMHFGGSLSMIEIAYALYIKTMKVGPNYFTREDRDRVIISKGHGVPAVYAALHQAGIVTDDELLTFKTDHTWLYGHPAMNLEKGMEFSTGSLGQGLSQGIGTAIGLNHKGNSSSRVYVILGDGECDEGSIWEAAMSASKFKLTNIVAIVDRNHIQYDGNTEEIMPLGSFHDKWKSFGWNVVEVDGHNVDALHDAFSNTYNSPTVILANTVKGKGISFMENDFSWHHKLLSKKLLEQAYGELGVL